MSEKMIFNCANLSVTSSPIILFSTSGWSSTRTLFEQIYRFINVSFVMRTTSVHFGWSTITSLWKDGICPVDVHASMNHHHRQQAVSSRMPQITVRIVLRHQTLRVREINSKRRSRLDKALLLTAHRPTQQHLHRWTMETMEKWAPVLVLHSKTRLDIKPRSEILKHDQKKSPKITPPRCRSKIVILKPNIFSLCFIFKCRSSYAFF